MDNLPFTRTKTIDWTLGDGVCLCRGLNPLAEIFTSPHYRANRIDDTEASRFLEEVCPGSYLHCLKHVFIGLMHREDDDPDCRQAVADNARCLNPVQFRHGDVHYDDIRTQRFGFFQYVVTVPGFTDNNHIA